MFRWKKLGNIFCPENVHPWLVSHASNPVPVVVNEKIVRVYFTGRDKDNRSHISFVDIDFVDGFKVLEIHHEPIIAPGITGTFDDSGAAMGCYLKHNNKQYLYYLGWNLKVTVPWQNSIGLATAKLNDENFLKVSRAPIMDRSDEDPFSISYPFILVEGGKFRMWYGSNLSWGAIQDQMNHVIKYAESLDGIHWTRTNKICINLMYKNEYAISKPWVMKIKDAYHMWYSYRGKDEVNTYRIGYAESKDGINWQRRDEEAGITVSESGWDSEMISYASVFLFGGKYYMLYNGNGYGKTGFGLATADGN